MHNIFAASPLGLVGAHTSDSLWAWRTLCGYVVLCVEEQSLSPYEPKTKHPANPFGKQARSFSHEASCLNATHHVHTPRNLGKTRPLNALMGGSFIFSSWRVRLGARTPGMAWHLLRLLTKTKQNISKRVCSKVPFEDALNTLTFRNCTF